MIEREIKVISPSSLLRLLISFTIIDYTSLNTIKATLARFTQTKASR
jgi:hypothetical protein